MKKHLARYLFGALCVLGFLGHSGKLWQIPFITALDAYLYDVRVRTFMPGTTDPRIVVVDIDEKSLSEIGRWPWSRNTVADMVRRLTDDYQVAVVGFDVVFAEPDESSGLPVLEKIGRGALRGEPGYQKALAGLRKTLDYDARFAETLHGRPVVLGYYFSNKEGAQRTGGLPAPVFPPGSFAGLSTRILSWEGFGANLAPLQKAAASGGHFNPLVDFDGNTRRVPLILEFQGAYYESLSLAMVRHVLGKAELHPGVPDGANTVEWLEIRGEGGHLQVPVDEELAALVPYRGYERSFPYVPAVDVIKGRVAPEVLRDRIVLVGTTAPGLMDLRATPVGGAYPGVEVHANLIAGMLDGSIREKPGFVLAIDFVQLLFFGALLTILLPLLSPVRATGLAAAAVSGLLALNVWLWNGAALVLPLAAAGVMVLLLFAFNMSWGFFVESRSKRQFTELFGQYVPPELVDEMARNPESYSMEGRNEELSVLFSDIRSFTSISEGMNPKELTQLMNEYLGAMTEVIRHRRGTLDKYIGDAIMAFWGAPVADPAHTRNAVLAALEMQQAVRALAVPFKARGWPELHIGVGINTGLMTVGDMGSAVRKAYTVMGDAVNLASRLEGITKEYGVGVVIGERTRTLLPEFACRELDRVRVKGKDEPVSIYEPWGLQAELSAEQEAELSGWAATLDAYRACRWDEAEALLQKLLQQHPDSHLYLLYRERIGALRLAPPSLPWDGVTVFKTK
ncbi:adenylate/guanylate cyclase domain-containing protein [Dechloromonas sp. ZY10]|uniref:CHASE2 domain-containing protein n=1 Tax=Dechloromonas aquae TaxID=2664436 RepID=UPI003528F601